MKKRAMVLLLILALLLGLTACGKKEKAPYNGIIYTEEEAALRLDRLGDPQVLDGCVVEDTIYLLIYGADGQSYQVVRQPLAEGEAELLPAYQPLGGENAFSLNGSLRAGPEGTLWLWEMASVNGFNADGEFTGREDLAVLRQLDAEGRELFRFEEDQEKLQEALGLGSISEILSDAEGDLIVRAEKGLAVMDRDGALQFTMEPDSAYGSVALLGDGRVGFCDWNLTDGCRLRVIDKASGGWGQTYPLSMADTAGVHDGDETALFYYNLGDELWAWRQGEDGDPGQGERMLNFLDAGIDRNSVNSFSFLSGGRLAVLCGQLWEDASKTRLSILTPTEAASLPEKKVLTYAAFYLGLSERAAILEFNRTNPEYVISVTDYSQYGTLTDLSGGMTKLATEIGAGRVPDILAVWNIPVVQWGARGLLEDLWPYIDNDPELGREKLMTRVLEAAETGGKLYEISDSFRFCTLTGARSVVGDRYTWTGEDMWAALEKMPEGSVPMRASQDRSGVLLGLMQMDWDRFVDWEKGNCRFDSEEFRELLEFCGSFPAAGSDTGYQGEALEVLERRQMLLSWDVMELDDLQEYRFLFGDEVSFVGYPNPWGEVGSSFMLEKGLSMSSDCRHKDAAWSFMRQLLLPHETIESNDFLAFPINKSDFQKKMEQDMTPKRVKNGQEIPYTVTVDAGSVELTRDAYAATQEDLDQIMALYEQVDTVLRVDSALADIIAGTAGAYFAGDKTLDETVELIQNRASLYISEQS